MLKSVFFVALLVLLLTSATHQEQLTISTTTGKAVVQKVGETPVYTNIDVEDFFRESRYLVNVIGQQATAQMETRVFWIFRQDPLQAIKDQVQRYKTIRPNFFDLKCQDFIEKNKKLEELQRYFKSYSIKVTNNPDGYEYAVIDPYSKKMLFYYNDPDSLMQGLDYMQKYSNKKKCWLSLGTQFWQDNYWDEKDKHILPAVKKCRSTVWDRYKLNWNPKKFMPCLSENQIRNDVKNKRRQEAQRAKQQIMRGERP